MGFGCSSKKRPTAFGDNLMLRVNLFDIEVYSPAVFPLPEKAEHPINSITIYDSYTNTYISIIIDLSRAGQKKIEEIELHPDAWDRFRTAVHVMTKANPQHRESKSKGRKEKGSPNSKKLPRKLRKDV